VFADWSVDNQVLAVLLLEMTLFIIVSEATCFIHVKSVLVQQLSHKFAFNAKISNTFVECRVC